MFSVVIWIPRSSILPSHHHYQHYCHKSVYAYAFSNAAAVATAAATPIIARGLLWMLLKSRWLCSVCEYVFKFCIAVL